MPEEVELLEQQEKRSNEEQTLSFLFQKVLGNENSPSLSKEQVDEILSQRREVMNYIHEDKKQDSQDRRLYLIVILVFVLLFSGLVLFKKPDLFSEVLSFLAGIFGGGLGGYGIGKVKQ